MKNTKRVYAEFAFFDRTGIQNFLEKQAKKGWILKRRGVFYWYFQRIEPQNIHYTVTYFSENDDSQLTPFEQKKSYLEFCRHSGWKLADNWGYMQIFYNEVEESVPIETDANLEIRTIHKAVKKQYLYFDIYRIIILLLMLGSRIEMAVPTYTVIGKFDIISISCLLLMIAWYIFDIIRYFLWYTKAKKAAALNGSFTKTRSYPVVHWLILGMLLIIAFSSFFYGLYSNVKGGLAGSIIVTVLLLLLAGILILVGWLHNREKPLDGQIE